METFRNNIHFYINSVLVFLYARVHSVPIQYCLQPLNRADCGMKPTPVFSYYKPGSRCEIEIWRGCPTLNKFDNEVDCSYHCIAKQQQNKDSSENTLFATKTTHLTDHCQGALNTSKCIEEEIEVFTFKNGTCIKSIWRGCDTKNKFTNEESCTETCLQYPKINVHYTDLEEDLNRLSSGEINRLDNVIDDVIKMEAVEPEIESMLLMIKTTTPSGTEVPTQQLQTESVPASPVIESTVKPTEPETTTVTETTTETTTTELLGSFPDEVVVA